MSKPVSAIGSETDLIICPYNVSHLILRHRFQVHLVRCRKSYPNAQVVTCPFNITHRVNKEELEWHVSLCTERKSFENFRYREAAIAGLTSSIDRTFCDSDSVRRNATFNIENGVSLIGGEFVEPSESWDDEPDVPSYDPIAYTEKTDVLRLPVGLTPSQRNAFRLAERKRLQSLLKY